MSYKMFLRKKINPKKSVYLVLVTCPILISIASILYLTGPITTIGLVFAMSVLLSRD